VLGVIRSLMHTAGVPGGAAPPVTVVQPVTITETQTTTVPVTVTVTVTGTGTDTGSSSNQTTGS
jgi:mRNA-degrading endonuclease toxin of MazEF toxin-antitoxin module